MPMSLRPRKNKPTVGHSNTHKTKSGTKKVTGTIGNAVGGITNTAGNVIGTAGRGTGNTINKTTKSHKGGDGVKDVTGGVERGISKFARGIERGSVGKKP